MNDRTCWLASVFPGIPAATSIQAGSTAIGRVVSRCRCPLSIGLLVANNAIPRFPSSAAIRLVTPSNSPAIFAWIWCSLKNFVTRSH